MFATMPSSSRSADGNIRDNASLMELNAPTPASWPHQSCGTRRFGEANASS
jgi:hypothetical protein